jgi:hypothetical protein
VPKEVCDVCGSRFPVSDSGGRVVGAMLSMNGVEQLSLCWECFLGGMKEAALLFRKNQETPHKA